jgi:hypothetical protein
MALPAAVTLGSLAFVVAAGGGYVALAVASASPPASAAHQRVVSPAKPSPSKPLSIPQHSSTAHHPVHSAVPDVLIEIYNNNGVTGRAEQAAATLQGAGWNVSATDSWYGNIPADTVYYPPALHDDAVKLAKVLHIKRLHAAVVPMKFDRLTVIMATS